MRCACCAGALEDGKVKWRRRSRHTTKLEGTTSTSVQVLRGDVASARFGRVEFQAEAHGSTVGGCGLFLMQCRCACCAGALRSCKQVMNLGKRTHPVTRH